MKKIFTLCFLIGIICSNSFAQNYMRVAFPEWWNRDTTDPNWHYDWEEGVFEEISIVTSPQGIYTNVDVYATITHPEDFWGWDDFIEIVWQFDLPNNAIVHDSWLWVANDIIKADVVDYWTALQTYTDIVQVQQDPSFLHQLDDNRYEIRIYPLIYGDSRKIKMSFLIPSEWDIESTKTNLLNQIFNSTTHLPENISVGMVQDSTWSSPELLINNQTIPLTEFVTNDNGDIILTEEIPTTDFVTETFDAHLSTNAPLVNKSFLVTYEDQGDQFYQLAYVPDWETQFVEEIQHSLILIDYDITKTSISLEQFYDDLILKLNDNNIGIHYINIAINGPNGVVYLTDGWELYDENSSTQMIWDLLNSEDGNDLELLLQTGFSWVNDLHPETNEIFLFAANEDYLYPEDALIIFNELEDDIPEATTISILNIHDQNVSNIVVGNEFFYGNEHLYNLLTATNSESNHFNLRTEQVSFNTYLDHFLNDTTIPQGILTADYSMPNGISYERYEIHDSETTVNSNGVILQTGKYIGDFPMQINAALIQPNGNFYLSNTEVQPNQNIDPDSLMRKIWYGPHLKAEQSNAATNSEIEAVIAQSIEERVLTGFTAFLALEPSQGGDPCIGCFGVVPTSVNTDDLDDSFELNVSPNPVTDIARIELITSNTSNLSEWNAEIYDATGRLIKVLDRPSFSGTNLFWQWNINSDLNSGMYHCKVTNSNKSFSIKIAVIK